MPRQLNHSYDEVPMRGVDWHDLIVDQDLAFAEYFVERYHADGTRAQATLLVGALQTVAPDWGFNASW